MKMDCKQRKGLTHILQFGLIQTDKLKDKMIKIVITRKQILKI
jgi:hypothetical protein